MSVLKSEYQSKHSRNSNFLNRAQFPVIDIFYVRKMGQSTGFLLKVFEDNNSLIFFYVTSITSKKILANKLMRLKIS